MRKYFILKNAISNNYWCGFYNINGKWTDDILESHLFKNKQEMEDWIENNSNTIEGMFLVVIEVWQ